MIIRGAIAVGLFVALAAFAATPRLRAGTRIAYLTQRHGQPYHIYKALFRLSALSNVDPTTCFGHPTGRNACYLTADERDTNLDEFGGLPEWQQDHVHEWCVILESKANPGTIDVQHMLHTIFGTNLPHRFSTMTEDDFKAAIGAAERSLNEEEFGDEDARPTFDWIDKNDNTTVIHFPLFCRRWAPLCARARRNSDPGLRRTGRRYYCMSRIY